MTRGGSSVLVVLADHSMDWSVPTRVVSLQPAVDADPLLAGRVRIAQNGGADLLSWTGPDADRAAAVARIREVVGAVDGVLSTHAPGELRLGPQAGDIVAHCRAGWRFSDPQVWSNPIPGNHGHPARCSGSVPRPAATTARPASEEWGGPSLRGGWRPAGVQDGRPHGGVAGRAHRAKAGAATAATGRRTRRDRPGAGSAGGSSLPTR